MLEALDDILPTGRRRLRFYLELLGYGRPREGTLALVEEWEVERTMWSLAEYRFDYHREPRGTGRRGHHMHRLFGRGSVLHAHCEDPHPLHPHYRDVELTLLEAADEFTRIHAVGELRCDDLFPLYV